MPGTPEVTPEQIHDWIDSELVESIDVHPDASAAFNYTVDMSNLVIHVLRRQPGGPVLIGQEIVYDEEIQRRVGDLDPAVRNELVARVRETLTEVPVIYGFRNEEGQNVVFGDMSRIFLEYRIYPDGLSQHELNRGLVDVWKAMRYLDDLPTLLDAVEHGSR